MGYKKIVLSILFFGIGSTELLLAMDQKVNSGQKIQELLEASCLGNTKIVRKLIEDGVSANATDKHGATGLHWASFNGHTETVAYLLKKDANVKATDNKGLTPLQYVLSIDGCNDLDVMRPLVGHGSSANETDAHTGHSCSNWTPLFYAVDQNDRESAGFFLKKGATVAAIDICGNTPLHYASLRSTPEMIKLLVASGADINHEDGIGQTPLYRTCCEGKYGLV